MTDPHSYTTTLRSGSAPPEPTGPEPTLPCSLISLPHSGGLAGRTANPREVISSWSPLPQPLSRAPSYCESLHCLDSPLTSPSRAQARSQPSPLIPWPRRSPPWLQPPSLWDGNSCPLLPPPRFPLAGGHLPPDALRQPQPHTPTSKLRRIFLPPNPPPPLPNSLTGPPGTRAPLSAVLPSSSSGPSSPAAPNVTTPTLLPKVLSTGPGKHSSGESL